MGQITEHFADQMMTHCGRGQHPPLTVWETEQLLRAWIERESFRKDAERYRHAKAHGWPMTGPQCTAWTFDGRMVFGDTPEAALDSAMAYRVPAVSAA